MDGRRTLTHDKSSHGLWPGELIIPSELESLGKKVCVDDHGSAFIILFYNMTLITAFCPKFTKKYNKQFLKDPVIGKLLPALE